MTRLKPLLILSLPPPPSPPPSHTHTQLASLSPEQEAKRYQLRRQVEDLDDLIRSKTDTKRAMEKEIESLLSQKRGYVWKGGEGGWEGVVLC